MTGRGVGLKHRSCSLAKNSPSVERCELRAFRVQGGGPVAVASELPPAGPYPQNRPSSGGFGPGPGAVQRGHTHLKEVPPPAGQRSFPIPAKSTQGVVPRAEILSISGLHCGSPGSALVMPTVAEALSGVVGLRVTFSEPELPPGHPHAGAACPPQASGFWNCRPLHLACLSAGDLDRPRPPILTMPSLFT